MTGGELIEGARLLVAMAPTSMSHRRGAAFLCRQALEGSVREALGPRDVSEARWSSRFLLLQHFNRDADSRRGWALWEQWSEVCHFHPYDLIPDHAQISSRIDDTEVWIEHLRAGDTS